MHSYRNIFLALLVLSLSACKKNPLELTPLDSFTVRADSMSTFNDSAYYRLGSLATFTFVGNPATVTFYSGETGKRYAYRGRTTADGTPLLIFRHTLNTGVQDSTLRVMLSFDFKGNVPGDSAATASNIATANWSNITPTKIQNKTASAIDTINLSSFATAGKKVVIAFKYTAVAGSIQNRWTIDNFALNNYLPDNTQYTIANLNAANGPITNYGVVDFGSGWAQRNILNTFSWVHTAGTSLVIAGATQDASATSNAEAWAITGPIDLKKVTPDYGVPIKDITASPTLPFTYRYSAKGRYNAVFEAGNNTIYESGSIARKIPMVIQ